MNGDGKWSLSFDLANLSKQGAPVQIWLLSLVAVFSFGCDATAPAPEVVVAAPASASLAIKPAADRTDDECCTDPGAISQCWWMDADRDGVTCSPAKPCPNGNPCDYTQTGPNGQGLCECAVRSDCWDGATRTGLCTEAGLCGPSYCNGFFACSCWGGCEAVAPAGYSTPGAMCQDIASGYPGYCCEGDYPADYAGVMQGFCSDAECADGLNTCVEDADCVDDNPCTQDYCNDGVCANASILYGIPEAPGCDPVSGGTVSTDCTTPWCIGGACSYIYANDGAECTHNPQNVDLAWYGDDPREGVGDLTSCYYQRCDASGICQGRVDLTNGLACDDDEGNSCTAEVCDQGLCTHDPSPNVGDTCNADDNACTVDACDALGDCNVGDIYDCDDSNWCTSPDTCVDADPDHLIPSCNNPGLNGNAVDFGYTDTDDCIDVICVNGFEDPTPTDCTGYNPEGYDLQCNSYACVDGNGEDNCTLDYTSHLGDACVDDDGCTVGDTCGDGGGFGVCQAGGPMDCNDDNPCTSDACADGVCVYTPLTGTPCDADGSLCTQNDACDATGNCAPGPMVDCSGLSTECTNGVCAPGTGLCEVQNLPAGSACNADDDGCTPNDECDGAGNCEADPIPMDCSGSNDQCNTGFCNSATGLCEQDGTPHEGDACDADGSLCTPNDTCQSGACVADPSPVDCSGMSDQCNNAVCDSATGNCDYDNLLLLDTACNLDDSGCTTETCQGPGAGDQALTCTVLSTVDCDDSNVCTADTCQALSWNTYQCNNTAEPDTTACDFDDNGCTQNDHCDGAGGCVAGTSVTAADCEAILGVDMDCNTAQCIDDNGNNYHCEAVIRTTDPGDCNADNDGCTLDTCVDSGDPDVGAVCTIGSGWDCSALDNPPCQTGYCDDFGDNYNYSCQASHAPGTTSCNADSNGCTVNDACDGAGTCTPGAAAVCTPTDACQESTCASTGENTYTCDETAIENCCIDAGDCTGLGLACEGVPAPPVGCSALACVDNACVCEQEAEGTDCTDYDPADYPPNCYDGLCDVNGTCVPTMHDAYNNLCSDVFEPGDRTAIDTTHDAYMGAIPNTVESGPDATLTITGSTLCANNNYYAAGDECEEILTGNDIGFEGRDLVYVFQYQTNEPDQYQLFSYIIKVQADYDIGIYIATDINAASECPEGDNPDADENAETFVAAPSERCSYPYQNTPMPPVVEDECNDNGNTLYGQDCCDPCIAGETCGYKWCKRGYNYDGSACDMCQGAGDPGYDPWTHTGNCDALWSYPEDPFNCDPETPSDPGYDDFDYMASAVISPAGATDGSWRTVFIFVDGVDGTQGNFYLTVEKRRWWAGPCDRVNDDARVYDLTNVGPAGDTFIGTLDNTVNSMHAGGGSCGGYGCFSGWSGKSACHGTGSANEFWPNAEIFKIHRSTAEGSAAYCVQTNESITDAADLVVSMWRRSSTALTICDESYYYEGCRRNNNGNSVQWQFTAQADRLYLLEVSQYSAINRVCSPTAGDDCNYEITVTEGGCPVSCVDPSTWYSGPVEGTFTVDGSGFSPDNVIDGNTSGASRNHDIGWGWAARDQLWRIDVTANATVRFSACDDGGYGGFDSQFALYDCAGNLVAQNDDGCGWYAGMSRFTVSLSTSQAPYYLVVDGYSYNTSGPYGIGMSYQ
ncbi:MAG: hypothetical protein QNJ97_06545 [Myxococcota bacterium]|nr:hypothetical protein [Myxococcota bacterium]